MQNETASLQIFHDDADGIEGVGLFIRGASVIEHEGELVPGCKFSAWQARCLAHALTELADRIET